MRVFLKYFYNFLIKKKFPQFKIIFIVTFTNIYKKVFVLRDLSFCCCCYQLIKLIYLKTVHASTIILLSLSPLPIVAGDFFDKFSGAPSLSTIIIICGTGEMWTFAVLLITPP